MISIYVNDFSISQLRSYPLLLRSVKPPRAARSERYSRAVCSWFLARHRTPTVVAWSGAAGASGHAIPGSTGSLKITALDIFG